MWNCETINRWISLNFFLHQDAKDKEKKSLLGIEKNVEEVVHTSTLGQGFK